MFVEACPKKSEKGGKGGRSGGGNALHLGGDTVNEHGEGNACVANRLLSGCLQTPRQKTRDLQKKLKQLFCGFTTWSHKRDQREGIQT